jgi:LPS sulfotransferase NodH
MPASRADWLGEGRVRHAIRAYGPWPLHRLAAPEARFAILTSGRTGSELLVSLLGAHPQIACDGELLAIRRLAPRALLDSRAALAGLRGARAWGFKVMRSHLLVQSARDPAEQLREMAAEGIRLIGLERRDVLQQAISFVRAAGGTYHHRRGDAGRFEPVALDPATVIASMVVLEEAARFDRELLAGGDSLDLVYEDDLLEPARQQATVDRIAAWLGLAPRPVASDLVKLTPRATAELVSNYDELSAAVAATRFAHFL